LSWYCVVILQFFVHMQPPQTYPYNDEHCPIVLQLRSMHMQGARMTSQQTNNSAANGARREVLRGIRRFSSRPIIASARYTPSLLCKVEKGCYAPEGSEIALLWPCLESGIIRWQIGDRGGFLFSFSFFGGLFLFHHRLLAEWLVIS